MPRNVPPLFATGIPLSKLLLATSPAAILANVAFRGMQRALSQVPGNCSFTGCPKVDDINPIAHHFCTFELQHLDTLHRFRFDCFYNSKGILIN